MVWHPSVYAELLAEKMRKHNTKAWLINTGWSGGAYGVGQRFKLAYTRAIIDAIHAGQLENVSTVVDPVFKVAVPTECPGVPTELMIARNTWADGAAYDATASKLAELFHNNFEQFREGSSQAICEAGPRVTTHS